MAEKTIKTKILLRYDVLSAWNEANPWLKAGEVAIVAIPANSNELNINGTTPPQILFKVGEGYFKDLPYASGKAADVYSWAKEAKLSIAKSGEGNVVSGIEWDATANGGKGGIKFTTASVATSAELKGVQDRLTVIEGTGEKSRITLLEEGLAATDKLIAESKAVWEKDDNTTYTFSQNGKSFTVTPSEGEGKTITFDYLTADEIKAKIEAYDYQNAEAVKAIVESYKYTTIESLNNYYTKGEIDAKGFLTEHQSLANYYNKTEAEGLVSPKADKSYVDEELVKKANASALNDYYTKTEIDGQVDGLELLISGLDTKLEGALEDIEDIYGENGEIATIKGNITDLTNNKADKTELASYETVANADLVRGRVSTLEGHFGIDGRVTVAEGKISELEGAVKTIMNGTDAEKIDSLNDLIEWADEHAPEVASIKEDIEANAEAIEGLKGSKADKTDLDSYYNKDAIDGKVSALEGQISGVDGKLASYETLEEANKVRGRVDTLESGIKTLNETTVPALDNRITEVEKIKVTSTSVTDGTNTFNKYDDTELAGKVTAVENEFKTVTVDGTETKGRVVTLEEKVTALEAKPFDTYATKDAVKEVADAVKVINETTIPGINNTISTLATKSELSSVEGKVDGVIADYLKGADKTELQGNIDKKQDIITDLDAIRSGAAAGATAVQQSAIADMLTKTEAATTYETIDNVKSVSDRVKVVEDNFADWAIIWDCGGASNN
jgi:hypothetical protein